MFRWVDIRFALLIQWWCESHFLFLSFQSPLISRVFPERALSPPQQQNFWRFQKILGCNQPRLNGLIYIPWHFFANRFFSLIFQFGDNISPPFFKVQWNCTLLCGSTKLSIFMGILETVSGTIFQALEFTPPPPHLCCYFVCMYVCKFCVCFFKFWVVGVERYSSAVMHTHPMNNKKKGAGNTAAEKGHCQHAWP